MSRAARDRFLHDAETFCHPLATEPVSALTQALFILLSMLCSLYFFLLGFGQPGSGNLALTGF